MSLTLKKMPELNKPVIGRVCWECAHVQFFTGDYGYSEYTLGSDFHMQCGKNYWEFLNYEDGLDEFLAKLESAELCATFKLRDEK
jgi:hypothetical protein